MTNFRAFSGCVSIRLIRSFVKASASPSRGGSLCLRSGQCTHSPLRSIVLWARRILVAVGRPAEYQYCGRARRPGPIPLLESSQARTFVGDRILLLIESGRLYYISHTIIIPSVRPLYSSLFAPVQRSAQETNVLCGQRTRHYP